VTDNRSPYVVVRGDEIIVTLPGSNFRVVYHNSRREPGLIVRAQSGNTSHIATITQAEFRAHAWNAATDKARKLGWV
jgi:hypothetical protein